MIKYPKYKVAAAHIAPVFNDNEKSLDKACDAIAEAARQDIKLLAFSECFLPGYPFWSRVARPTDSETFFIEHASRAIRINGPEINRLRAAARKHDIMVSMGFSEGTDISVGCLWNSNVLIGNDGSILNHHRKLVPTFYEKLVWANGDGAGLRVSDNGFGRVGMLICGENTNPLARFTLMAQGEQVHIATYHGMTAGPASDGTGGYDVQAGIRIRAAAHSFEAKAFTIVASTPWDHTARAALEPLGKEILDRFDSGTRTISMIVDPMGKRISEELCEDEGFAVAEIDLVQAVKLKRIHDVVGYYNRFDIFNLTVNRKANRPVTFIDGPDEGASDCNALMDDGSMTID